MCSVITVFTYWSAAGLEPNVLGVQSEGLTHGEFLEDPATPRGGHVLGSVLLADLLVGQMPAPGDQVSEHTDQRV